MTPMIVSPLVPGACLPLWLEKVSGTCSAIMEQCSLFRCPMKALHKLVVCASDYLCKCLLLLTHF